MPRSIQTRQKYEAEKKAWDEYQEAIRAGGARLQKAGDPPPTPKPPDEYSDKLAKYIPAEVVTMYLALIAATNLAAGNPTSVEWLVNHFGDDWQYWLNLVAFLAGLIGTPLFLRFVRGVKSTAQLAICTISFIVWAVAIPSGIFKSWPPIIAGFVLPLYTFIVAFFPKTKP